MVVKNNLFEAHIEEINYCTSSCNNEEKEILA